MTKALAFLLGAATALSLFPSPARADDSSDEATAIQTMHDFGSCVVAKSRFRAERLLKMMPGTSEEQKLASEVSSPSCLGDDVELRFKAKFLRGAVAEAMLKSDFGTIGSPTKRKTAPIFAALTREQFSALGQGGKTSMYILDFATCIVGRDPASVDALFATKPASPDENAAFNAMSGSFAPCAPAGTAFRIVKSQLRGFLAEAAYRKSVFESSK